MSLCLDWCRYFSPCEKNYVLPKDDCCYCCGGCCCEGSGEIERAPINSPLIERAHINSPLSRKIYAPLSGEDHNGGKRFLRQASVYCQGEGASCCKDAPERQHMPLQQANDRVVGVAKKVWNLPDDEDPYSNFWRVLNDYQNVVDEEV